MSYLFIKLLENMFSSIPNSKLIGQNLLKIKNNINSLALNMNGVGLDFGLNLISLV